MLFNPIIYPIWQSMLIRFNENKDKLIDNENIQWIYNIDLDKLNKKYKVFHKRVFRFIKKKIMIMYKFINNQ